MQFFLHGLRHTQTVGCCLNQPHKCDGCLPIYASVLGFVSHSKNKFVGLIMMFVMSGSLCQGLAFIHHKHLLSCQNCILECY